MKDFWIPEHWYIEGGGGHVRRYLNMSTGAAPFRGSLTLRITASAGPHPRLLECIMICNNLWENFAFWIASSDVKRFGNLVPPPREGLIFPSQSLPAKLWPLVTVSLKTLDLESVLDAIDPESFFWENGLKKLEEEDVRKYVKRIYETDLYHRKTLHKVGFGRVNSQVAFGFYNYSGCWDPPVVNPTPLSPEHLQTIKHELEPLRSFLREILKTLNS